MKPFTQCVQALFLANQNKLTSPALPQLSRLRQKAMETFVRKGLPTNKLETWRHRAIDEVVEPNYSMQCEPSPYRPVEEYFKCQVKKIDTFMFSFLNGWYVHQNSPLTIFPDGLIIGSLMAAMHQYPELVFAHLAQQDLEKEDGLTSLNEALFTDGLFVYIPENLSVDKTMQIVSLVDSPLLVQQHNLIIVGKNSTFSLVQCDDSIKIENSFINNMTEVVLEENARFTYYKLENKDEKSLLTNQVFVKQMAGSQFTSNTMTFNAGFVRNRIQVELLAPNADAKLYGLYLVDKKQYVDNQIMIRHLAPDCTSYQLYKGIADDEAWANFNGHIYVAPHAQRTNAYQSSKNISLTDEARITTQPFLEIYADDVKCSHGSTVGQLDEEALFYLRSRGICERNARMLLLYAFANEMANFAEIDSLRERLNDMIKKRLSGELTICDNCVLHCSEEKHFTFDIDLSKI